MLDKSTTPFNDMFADIEKVLLEYGFYTMDWKAIFNSGIPQKFGLPNIDTFNVQDSNVELLINV